MGEGTREEGKEKETSVLGSNASQQVPRAFKLALKPNFLIDILPLTLLS